MALLETTRVRKWFGGTHAVDDVDFVVNQGELLGLIGSNGAGKTTLVNLISGLLRPDAGRIVFDGADVTRQSVHERIRERSEEHTSELQSQSNLLCRLL